MAIDGGTIGVALLLGIRHGIDIDHIAAIADITSLQPTTRRALTLATLYAVGHAVVVFVLGIVAVIGGAFLPPGVDAVMQRIIGVTLIALGAYVAVGVARHGRDVRFQSRWMLALRGIRRTIRWLRHQPEVVVVEHEHEHDEAGHHHHDAPAHSALGNRRSAVATATHTHVHRHVVVAPDDPLGDYTPATSLALGAIHGVGVETPTQLAIFVATVGAASRTMAVGMLVAFGVGLVVANTALAVAARAGFATASGSRAYVAVAALTAIASVWIGSAYLLGLQPVPWR